MPPKPSIAVYSAMPEPEEEKSSYRDYEIPIPDGFKFESEEQAKHGDYFTVKLKEKGGKLCITEIEGIITPGYDTDEDGE